MTGQCCFRYSGNCWTVIPSTPALPLLALTRANACLQFSRPQTSSINCSVMAGLSVPRFPPDDSVPSTEDFGASLPLSSMKASSSWFFCRLSSMSRAAYSPLPLPSLRRIVWGLHLPVRPTPYTSDPVLVHRLRRFLAVTPLRFAITSPSGCAGDFHPELSNMLRQKKPGIQTSDARFKSETAMVCRLTQVNVHRSYVRGQAVGCLHCIREAVGAADGDGRRLRVDNRGGCPCRSEYRRTVGRPGDDCCDATKRAAREGVP